MDSIVRIHNDDRRDNIVMNLKLLMLFIVMNDVHVTIIIILFCLRSLITATLQLTKLCMMYDASIEYVDIIF